MRHRAHSAVQDEINEVEFPAFQTFLTDNYVLQFSYDATATPKADVDLQPVLLLHEFRSLLSCGAAITFLLPCSGRADEVIE